MASAQNYKSHTRWDPLMHFFILPILLFNIVMTGWWYRLHRFQFMHTGMWFILISIVLFLLALKVRTYAVKNQDRIIRLEERIRLASVVSASELIELESLTTDQLVGLRFASNPELPDLARRAIREKLTRKQIKENIVTWRDDNDRV